MTKKTPIRRLQAKLFAVGAAALALGASVSSAFPVITDVVETGGDNDANDTVFAKWTGQTWSDHANNEPIIGLTTGQPYTVGLFGNHAPTFVDRSHRFTNASDTVTIPSYLIGGEYIMSGNDNRDNAGYTLDVSVAKSVKVYMLIDNRLSDADGATPPTFGADKMQWIVDEGWTPVTTGANRFGNAAVPDEVGIDEGADGTINQWYSVYSKEYPSGTFRLKQADNAGQNMYGAVVVPTGSGLTAVNVGGNAIGTVTEGDGGTITIVGGGNDIWDMSDEFTYAYGQKAGDFDVQVRVDSLTFNGDHTKAGIMVRESLAEDSRHVFLQVKPTAGANQTKFSYRTGHFASATDGDPGENDGRHEDPADQNAPPYPNAWLRVVRSGNVFSAHISTDGVAWTQIASQDTGAGNWQTGGGAFRESALVGLAVCRNGAGPTATAVFKEYKFNALPFTLLHASSRGNPNAILVSFSAAPDAATLVPGSFDVVGVTITSVTPGPWANSYWLNTDAPLTEGTDYSVACFSVTSGGNGPINDTDTFTHGKGYEQRAIHVGHNKTREGGDGVLDNTSYQRRLFAQADGQVAVEGNVFFEDPLPDNGTNERFYTTIFGILNVATAGNYQFAVSSDDIGNLYLSSDENPANKTRIAREPEWNGSRQYAATDRPSRPGQHLGDADAGRW
jgi:hypothetical protein